MGKIKSGFSATLLAVCLLVGCDNAFQGLSSSGSGTSSGSGGAGGNGAISISIPAVATWIQSCARSIDASVAAPESSSSPKALAYATKATIEILKSDGTQLVAPSTLSAYSWNLSSTSSSTLSSIPAGTGYTVKVSVYNTYVSSSEPTVVGSKTGIDVTNGGTTSVSITCLPCSATPLSLDSPASASLIFTAEKWFSMPVVENNTYYFSQGSAAFSIGLFSSDGAYLSSGKTAVEYKAAYSGTLYICLVNSGASGTNSTVDPAKTGTLLASATTPTLSEGSTGDPVSIALDVEHSFACGKQGQQDTSYYAFTTSSAGAYALSTSYSWYSAYLYSDQFSTQVASANYCSRGAIFPGLSASTKYFLKIVSESSSDCVSCKGKIVSTEAMAATSMSEGSIISPITLSDGSLYAGKVGSDIFDQTSYYKFPTGAGVDYRLAINGSYPSKSLYIQVFSDPAFSSAVKSDSVSLFSYLPATYSTDVILAPNSTYYLAVTNRSTEYEKGDRFGITISGIAAPTFSALPVASGNTWTAGTVKNVYISEWYEASVDANTAYTICFDSKSTNSSGSYSLSGTAAVLSSSRSSTLVSSCTYSGTDFTTGASDTKIYVIVTCNSNNAGTFAIKLLKK